MIPKFRAWDKKFKEMVQVDAIVFEEQAIIVTYKNGNIAKGDVKEYVLMQSTGLHDKNSKEIFEGDIIRYNIDVIDIKRHPTLGFYTVLDGREGFFGDGMSIDDFEEDVKEFSKTAEIIGNIYENPELLEVEE